MKVIYKYTLPITGSIEISAVGNEARILKVAFKNDIPTVWVEQEVIPKEIGRAVENLIITKFLIRLVTTGEYFEPNDDLGYLDTIISQDDSYVLHIFTGSKLY